jgi:outer membrane protein TolC
MRRFLPVIAALAVALGLAGCLVGPNYHRPAVNLPQQFPGSPATQQSIANETWFNLFHDATLNELVQTALKQNFDVRIAAERVLEARA